MNTRPEASRATKFTYLLSCFANELVHRRLGVFCTVFTFVYWGELSILRRDASRHKAWILGRRPRARLSLLTYLAALLMSWFIVVLGIGVSMYRCSDDAHWFIGSSVHWYRCIELSMYRCIGELMYRSIVVLESSFIEVYRCIDVSLHPSIDVSVY